jgi:hypothetical protein
MIPCRFVKTEFETTDGRPVSRCSRPGCEMIGFNFPDKIIAECRHPSFAAGDAIANTAKLVNLTEKTWPRLKHWFLVTFGFKDYKAPVGGCGCGNRRQWANRKFTKPLPEWAYKMLVLAGFRRPVGDRLAKLVDLGRIVKVGDKVTKTTK